MAQRQQQQNDARRKDLFSSSERAQFRKREQDPALVPPMVDSGEKQKAVQAPGQAQRKRIGFHRDVAAGPIEKDLQARQALDSRSYRVIWLGIGVVIAYLATLILPDYLFDVNNRHLSPAWFFSILQNNFHNLVLLVSGGGAYGGIDFTAIRLAIVGLAGAALAVSGAAFQGSLKNQLASPSTLGVMSGAQFGNVLYLMLMTAGMVGVYNAAGDTLLEQTNSMFSGMNVVEYTFAVFERGFYSLVGSIVVVCIVLFVSHLAGHGRSSRVAMVVTGQVVATLISSFVVVVRIYVQEYGSADQLDALRFAMSSNFSSTFTLPSLVLVGVPILVCIGIILVLRNRINLLAFNEMEAMSMGIRTKSLKVLVVACCTIMTAVVVAFCGTVGYVGFLVPHLARRIVGPDFKYLIPASALLGAIFLLVVYYLAMCFTVPGGGLSTVTSALGIVAFVLVVFQQRRSGYASW